MKKYLKESFLGKPFLTILLLMVFSLSNSYSQVYEPTYHVTGFTIGTVTSTSIQLNWTGSVGFKLPSSYVILAKKGAGSYASVSDGSDVSDDSDWSNNNAAINIAHSVGANTYTFSSLTPNTSYDFIIYPYNGTGATIDYKTDPTIPTLTQATDPTAATIVLSDNTINEGSESSGVITVTVSNDTYINPADGADWTVTNLPDGVTKGAVNYVDPTHVTIGLSGDRSVDYDNSITNVTVSCTADALTLNSVTGASASTGVTLVANNDGESLAISGGPYTEGSEDGQTVTVTLTGGTFASSLTAGNWSLNNAPVGVGVLSVVPVDATHITLTFNGDRTTDYDANITTMTVTAGATEIDDSNTGVTSSTGVTFTAITETAAITHAGLTEANLNTAVVTYNLTNETFADATLSDGNFTLNAPSGTTVNSVAWVSSTQATVTLAFDGTDFDGNFTTFNITCDAVEFTGSGNITSDDLTITALTESAAITHAGLTEANLNTAIVTYTLTNETFADGSLLTGSFTLGNAPTGTTVNSVGYSSSTVATVTLAFNGTDFDSDVTTFNITCAAVELSRAANITSNNLTITATDETAAITYGGGLTEANLNTAGVTLTLTNETFADNSYDPANFTLNAPTGTTVTAVNYVSSTQVTVILAFDGTDFDSDFTTFNITVAAAELTGSGNITSDDLTITALVESATITHGGLLESNLQGAAVGFVLSNETFADGTLDESNFTLNNAPSGTTISSVGYTNSTTATVNLAFNGTDFDANITTFNITVLAAELSRAGNITSNNLTITATDETAAITYGGGLTEANLNTAGVTLTLTNETFADNSYDPANFTLNAPTGTTVTAVNYVSSTQVTVILAFDGTDFDANFTTFHITVAAVELTGTGNITSNDLTITALVESAAIAHAGLTEANLNTAVVTYTLTNETFDDITLVKTNFTLNNEPTGTTIASVGYSSSTEATVTLAFDGTDFDSDVTTFNITCAAVELSRAANITSNNLTITAIDETVINVSTTSLTHFGNVQTGNNSSEQSFTVAGVDLNTDITITPPTGFEISETTGPFSSANPITLTPTGGTVSTTTIYVRFSPTVAGEASGNITNTSTGATAKNVAVAGTGTTAGAASNVAITEVVDYNGSDNLDFIEIYNSGNASAYINGYVLTERYEAGTSTTSRSIILNASTQGNTGGSNYLTLEQGEYAIICKGTASNFRSTYTSIGNNVAIFSNSTLPGIDGNERYQLDGTAKAILDNYGDWDDGGVFSLTPDKSYERITTSSTGELESDWTRTTSASYEPTPAGTNNNPLPIELVSFKAIVVGDIINLEWITASETNNDYFTVEKSIDAEYFDILTNIVGAGNSNNFVYYSTKDKNPIEGINYYRLKQTDFDGEFSYSDIIFVNKNKNTIVFEQPYKSGSSLQTFLYNQTGKTLNVEIINLLGQVIYREEIKPQTDTHFISLNINKFTKGIYLLRISNETDFLVKRFLN